MSTGGKHSVLWVDIIMSHHLGVEKWKHCVSHFVFLGVMEES